MIQRIQEKSALFKGLLYLVTEKRPSHGKLLHRREGDVVSMRKAAGELSRLF